jgi:hypothetical protein
MLNAVGDVVLTDPEAMFALAQPGRLGLLDRLRRSGPSSAAELASGSGEPASEIDAQLRELERFGLAESDGSTWRVVGKGVFFELPDDPEGQAAARALANAMFLRYAELPERWVAEDEPQLEPEWVRAAGLFNARPTVTPDELQAIQEALEALLAPYLTREPADAPASARRVRVLGYFLPEPSDR